MDARRVCADLGVRHYLLNYRTPFREEVIDPFVAAYRSGETPNPCVRCNNHLKFDLLVQRTREIEAPWLATGHYARVLRDGSGRPRLFKGIDRSKDQSYFLHGTPVAALKMVCFPLGCMRKTEVRAAADRLNVRTRNKPDSQDVCFIPGGDTAAFLARQGGAEGISPHPLGSPAERQQHHPREHPPSGRCPVTVQRQCLRPINLRSRCLQRNYWCLDCSRRHHGLSGPGNGAALCDMADPGKQGRSHTRCMA